MTDLPASTRTEHDAFGAIERDRADDPAWCRDAAADPRRRLLVTAHRRESWGEPMERIGAAIARLAADRPDLLVLVPMILCGHAGTKYGIPFPVFARASFGVFGSHVPSLARALVATGGDRAQAQAEAAAARAGLERLGAGSQKLRERVEAWLAEQRRR